MASKSKIKGSAYEAKIRDLLTKELNIELQEQVTEDDNYEQ